MPIVDQVTSGLTKSAFSARLLQLSRARVGDVVDTYTQYGQFRTALNDSTPPEYKIGNFESITSVRSKLNTYHNTSSRIVIENFMNTSVQAFYDFTALGRIYQDSLGTLLTTPGQSVGLIRDGIAPTTFGSELLTNGNFATDTIWSKGSGWTITGGLARKASGAVSNLSQAITITPGRTYKITGNLNKSAGSVSVGFTGGTAVSVTPAANGVFEAYLTAVTGNSGFTVFANSTATIATIDDISVKEVTGVVAIQTSTSLRGRWASWPVIGRRNLVGKSEITAAQASGSGVTTATTSITGFESSIQFGDNSVSRWAYVGASSNLAYTVGATGTVSFYVQMDDGGAPVIGNVVGPNYGDFCIVVGGNVAASPAITAIGNGIYRVYGSGTIGAQSSSNGPVKYSTQSSRTFKVTGYQVEFGGAVTTYQKVVSSTEIVESGVDSSGAWQPDLVDDAINFTLSSAVDGESFIIGRNGSWRESRSSTLGTSVSVGGTTAGTSATRGILKATGDVLALGFRAGTMTTDQWQLLKRKYQDLGAKGEFIVGSELITNGTFTTDTSGWIANSGGSLSVVSDKLQVVNTTTGNGNGYQIITTMPGVPYLMTAELTGIGGIQPRIMAGTQVQGQQFASVQVAGGPTNIAVVFIPTGTSTWITAVTNSNTIGATAQFDNISVKPLTPEW